MENLIALNAGRKKFDQTTNQQTTKQQTVDPSTKKSRPHGSAARNVVAKLKITPAMIGVVAVMAAGLGSFATAEASSGSTLASLGYQAIEAPAAADRLAAADDKVDVSRSYDRAPIAKETATQVKQRTKALAESDRNIAARADAVKLEKERLAQEKKARQARQAEKRRTGWVLPVKGYTLTARFGQHSSLWSSGAHTGLDFAGPSGTKIVAIASGTVESVGYSGAYGNRTVITLADGMQIWYCHQSKIVAKAGDKVSSGQLIGYTGSTGNVTGPHLHVEVKPSAAGAAVDPDAAMRAHGVTP